MYKLRKEASPLGNKYLNLEQQKFHLFNINNRLRYNVHLSKYQKNEDDTYHDDKCTTCKLSGVLNIPRENGHHLYIECFKAKEITTHIIDTFNIQHPVHNEEIIFFSNHEDYWERLKRNIIFLEFKIHLNKCRRAKTIPNNEDMIRAIQKCLLMIYTTRPMDKSLIDGLLPLVTGVGLSKEQAERILFRSNNSPTIMFESQRRNTFLATKTSSNLIINSDTDCVHQLRASQSKNFFNKMFPNWSGESRTSFRNTIFFSRPSLQGAMRIFMTLHTNLKPPNKKIS